MTGASTNRKPIDVRGRNCSLASSLTMSASGWSDAERADAVRAVAVLEAAEQLALGEQHDRHDLQADGEDHERLEDLHPPRLVVDDVGERVRRASCACGTSHRAGRRAPMAESLGDRRPPGRPCPPASRRAAHRRARRAAVGADDDASPSSDAEALGVGGRHLDALARREELQRGGDARPRARPRSSGRCPGAGAPLARRPAAAAARASNGPALGRRAQAAAALALLPAHAAAADRVERQPRVERDGVEELGGGHRAGEHAGVEAEARGELREHPPLGARRRPGGRSPGAGAARGRRGA